MIFSGMLKQVFSSALIVIQSYGKTEYLMDLPQVCIFLLPVAFFFYTLKMVGF